jgi:hypothetical protein
LKKLADKFVTEISLFFLFWKAVSVTLKLGVPLICIYDPPFDILEFESFEFT